MRFAKDDSCGWFVSIFGDHPPAATGSTQKVISGSRIQELVGAHHVGIVTVRAMRSSGAAHWRTEVKVVGLPSHSPRLDGRPNAEAIGTPPVLQDRRQHQVRRNPSGTATGARGRGRFIRHASTRQEAETTKARYGRLVTAVLSSEMCVARMMNPVRFESVNEGAGRPDATYAADSAVRIS